MFIEPTGNVHPVSTHEKMCPAPHFSGIPLPHTKWTISRFTFIVIFYDISVGSLFPQNSVPFNALHGASQAIGRTLFEKGVIGYVSIHFTAFWDSFHGGMRIWATDLFLSLTNTAASFLMFNFVMGGRFDVQSGQYQIPQITTPSTADKQDNNHVVTEQDKSLQQSESMSNNSGPQVIFFGNKFHVCSYSVVLAVLRCTRVHLSSQFIIDAVFCFLQFV